MAKLTVAEIKRQISALEAKAARLIEDETKASVGKVRALMNDLGVTLEHLSSATLRKVSAVKKVIVGKKRATAKRASKGAAKYRDPKTGATWSGVGRAPGWIATAKNRDAFLVSNVAEGVAKAPKKQVAASRKAAGKKSATAKKATTRTKGAATAKKAVAVAKKAVAVAKKAAPKAAAKKAAAKKAAKKRGASSGASAASTFAESAAPSAT